MKAYTLFNNHDNTERVVSEDTLNLLFPELISGKYEIIEEHDTMYPQDIDDSQLDEENPIL